MAHSEIKEKTKDRILNDELHTQTVTRKMRNSFSACESYNQTSDCTTINVNQ